MNTRRLASSVPIPGLVVIVLTALLSSVCDLTE
jgi:hypothetical protein